MKKLLFTTLFAFMAVPLFAQWAAHTGRINREAIRNNRFINDPTIDEVDGSPFYYKEWEKGRIITKTDEVSDEYDLLYIVLTNQLLIQQNGEIFVVDPAVAKGFTFHKEGKKTTFKKGFTSSEHDIEPDKYLRIIYDGKLKFAANYEIEKRKHRDMMTNKVILNLKTEKQYYLITANGTFHEVEELAKDDILKALPGDNAKLEQYATNLSLDYSNPSHLKKILSIYEQLNAKKAGE